MASEARMLTAHNAEFIANWCKGKVVIQHDALDESITIRAVNIETPTGVERAQPGDMVICQNDGSFIINKREYS
jgi:hypothetical protein